MKSVLLSWQFWALLSAAFAALTFEGCGLGGDYWTGQPLIDSLADLVENAQIQLVVEPL